MKKILSFLAGILVGALSTFLVCSLVISPKNIKDSSSEKVETNTFLDETLREETISRLSAKKTRISKEDVYETMMDSVMCSLFELGYEAFPAYAVISSENDLVPGIAYTDYEIYDDTEEIIYSCGFYQIIVNEEEIGITDELIQNGLFANLFMFKIIVRKNTTR